MRDFFRPARVVGGGSGTKFSLLAQNGPKSAFWGVLGEFCTGIARRAASGESFVPGGLLAGDVLGEFCTECVDVRSWVAICSQQMAEPVDGGLLANGGRTRG